MERTLLEITQHLDAELWLRSSMAAKWPHQKKLDLLPKGRQEKQSSTPSIIQVDKTGEAFFFFNLPWVQLLRHNLGFGLWKSCSRACFSSLQTSASLKRVYHVLQKSSIVNGCGVQLSLWNGNICTLPLQPSPAHLKEWLRKKGEGKVSCQIWHQTHICWGGVTSLL